MSGTLFVRSGGGFPGLDIHAGIWMALDDAGIRPTACHGTSAGALTSAMQAAGHDAARNASILSALCDSDVRDEVFAWHVRAPWIDYWLSHKPIAAILDRLLPSSWSSMSIPFCAWATDIETGRAANVARPDVAPTPARAALASMSLCGVFPAVDMLDGRSYVDGGPRRNLPLPGDWRGYDEVWLLIASGRPSSYRRRHGILTHLLRNVQFLMLDQVADILELTAGAPNVHVIWPSVQITRGMLHFDHRLIGEARRQTAAKIAELREGGAIRGGAV